MCISPASKAILDISVQNASGGTINEEPWLFYPPKMSADGFVCKTLIHGQSYAPNNQLTCCG